MNRTLKTIALCLAIDATVGLFTFTTGITVLVKGKIDRCEKTVVAILNKNVDCYLIAIPRLPEYE